MPRRTIVPALAMFAFVSWPCDIRAADEKKLPELNDKVLKFAEASVGKQIGNGECWTLADEALAEAGARRPGRDGWGVYVFGRELKADEAVLPGDIVQFTEARFESKGGMFAEIPQHTAVVTKREGGKLSILHQNWNKSTKVAKLDLDLAELKKGTVTFFRPQPTAK
jgi:myosin tail region-interacting protein MTI1